MLNIACGQMTRQLTQTFILLKQLGTKKLRTKTLELRSLELRRLDLCSGQVLDLVWQRDPAGGNRVC